jgi:uncharacterized protein
MLYRKMPKTADELSILGFGCMRLPQVEGRIDEARAIAQIRSAIDGGVNYVDTAWPYHGGTSESLVGRALADGYRERVRLATKLPSWMISSREEMDRYLDAQLVKLNTSKIDYYLLHSMNGGTWDRLVKLGVVDFLERAKAAGKIGNVGFSFHGPLAEFKRMVDAYPWVFCQMQYNYLDVVHQAGTEGLKYASGAGLGVIIMQPLRGGTLGRAVAPPAVASVWERAQTKRTPAEWGLRWMWDQPEVTVALSGMNDEAQVEENLRIASVAAAGSLTEAERALVAEAGRVYHEIMLVGCTGCGYCEPCPMGVSISGSFDVYNHSHMFGDAQQGLFKYAIGLSGMLSGRRGYASQCERCGDCVVKCPQGLEIPDLLEKVVAEFETPALAGVEKALREAFSEKIALRQPMSS